MENNTNFINPLMVAKVDIENSRHILIATLVSDDGETRKTWMTFDSRKETYDYIKSNLETESEIIDIDNSMVLMEKETYNPDSFNIIAFMIVTAGYYDETFNPNHYRIKD